MLRGILRKIFFISFTISFSTGLGGLACIGGSGGGGGAIGPLSDITPPPVGGAATPEVLGSVTEAPQVTESCFAQYSMRFLKESADSENLPVVLTILPGQNSEYENAVVEELSSPTQKIVCERCKKRLIRMIDFGTATGNSSGNVIDTQGRSLSINSDEGAKAYFTNLINGINKGMEYSLTIRMRDFSFDESSQSFSLKNWAPEHLGMYLFLLAPDSTEKVSELRDVGWEELKSMLKVQSVNPDTGAECVSFYRIRQARVLTGEAPPPPPPSAPNGIISIAPESQPYYKLPNYPLYYFVPPSGPGPVH